jgi:hypothetical protein
MIADPLGKLFGTPARVKMLRLFLFNPETLYDKEEIAAKTRSPVRQVVKELQVLKSAKLIRQRNFTKTIFKKKDRQEVSVNKRVIGWGMDERFPYQRELRQFMLATIPVHDSDIAKRLSRAGRIALVVVGGSFLDPETDSQIDLLVVGDRINRAYLEAAIKTIEAEIGRDIRYAQLTLPDFSYRRTIHDRLIRNVFDFPHRAVLDRMNLI